MPLLDQKNNNLSLLNQGISLWKDGKMAYKKSMFSPLKAWKYLFSEPVTLSKDQIFLNPRQAEDRYRGFHRNHQDQCTGCGTCAAICPTEAIHLIPVEGREANNNRTDMLPVFDYGRCSFCGLCVDICSSDSLGMTKEYIHVTTDVNTFIFMPGSLGIHETYYPDGYTRDKDSELLDLVRYPIEEIPYKDRNRSFMELIKGFSTEMAIAEASRCVSCGICTSACPAHMHIPEYIQAIYDQDLEKGINYLFKTNPLPNVCGRICTHKCESACVISNRGEAVSIRWLKRYIMDSTDELDYDKVILGQEIEKNGKKVAIVGSGPAGLSAAYYLTSMGYDVTIYESRALPGGVVRYGAPEYRLPEAKVAEDIALIKKLGVKIICKTTVGKDIDILALHENNDAVFIATGFWLPKKLNITNKDHEDVVTSVDFLAAARDYTRGIGPMPDVHEDCIVIGGGDVSFDVARTLVRFQLEKYGKHHVEFIARKSENYLAASLEEIVEAREEEVSYNLNASPESIDLDSKGKIFGVTASKCETIEDNGKIKTLTLSGEQCCIKGTQVYFAVGTSPDYSFLLERLQGNLHVDKDKLQVKENGQFKNYDWLFAGGDIVNGPDIISAIADGHKAAKGIDAYLLDR
jgi:glutamate synthase (NADPH/NADH) small chain